MNGANAKVEAILKALKTLPPFDYDAYQSSIQSLLGVDKNSWGSVVSGDLYGETPSSPSSSNIVQRFKVQTMALGISRNSQYGFADTVIMNGFQDRLNETSSSLVVPVYRYHLEKHLAANGVNYTIDDLASNQAFCTAFLSRVLTSEFINDALIVRYFDHPEYTEAIAYLYERLRPSLSQMPAEATFTDDRGLSAPVRTVFQNHLPNIQVYLQTASASKDLSDAGKTQEFLNKSLPLVWSNDTLLQQPKFPSIGVAWANKWLSNTYATGVISNLISSDESSQYYPSGGEGPGTTWVTYGDKLWQWIKTQQANGYGDTFNVTKAENSKYVSPFGCFAPGTIVATADGDVPIEQLKPSTKVMTKAPGEYGRTSSERVEHPTSYARPGQQHVVVPLYGFNGEEPFVTEGHIFFTASGPRAINPAVAMTENNSSKVGQLQTGDILLRLNKDRTGYDQVKIDSITRAGSRHATVHGLHFAKGSEGGHKYHANGYWVGENYPQLTINGLLEKYHKLSLKDQKQFTNQVANLPKSFRDVLGSGVFDTVQRVFSDMSVPSKMNLAAVHQNNSDAIPLLGAIEDAAKRHISIKSVVARYKLVHHGNLRKSRLGLDTTDPNHADTIAKLNGDITLPEVSFCHGAVVVHHKDSPSLASHVSMSHLAATWSKPLEGKEGMYQHGVLRSIFHGRAALGYVATGPAEVNSIEDFSSVTPVMAVSAANTYNINFSSKIFSGASDAISAKASDQDGWTPFWKVSIGLSYGSDGGYKIALSMPDLDTEWVNQFGEDAKDSLPYQTLPAKFNSTTYIMTIQVQVCPGTEDFLLTLLQNWGLKGPDGKPIAAGPAFNEYYVYLNLMTNELHGFSYELQPDGKGSYQNGPLHGLTTPGSNTVSEIRKTVNRLVGGSPSAQASLQDKPASSPSAKTMDVQDPSANIHAAALPAADVLASNLFTEGDLSVADLQTTPAPTDTALNSQSQQYMQNAGNYWRLDPEVELFGNDQAALKTALPASGSLTDQLDSEARAWFGKYDRGLMLQALQRESKYAGGFTDADAAKMTYYWQGGQAGCISSDTQFNRVSEICAREAFLALTPGMKPYIQSSEDWANQFFAFVSTDDQLNLQAFAMSFDPGASNLTNRYCMILNALDQMNRQYDVQLWNLVRDKLLCSVSNGTIKADQDTPLFLQDFVEQLILEIQTDSSGDLLSQLKVDLAGLQETFATNDAHELAERVFSDTFELGQCFLETIKDLGDIIAQRNKANFSDLMKAWEKKITDKYPTNGPKLVKGLRYATAFVGLAVDAYGLYQSIKYLQAWGTLTKPEKAEAVISLVQFVIKTGSDLGSLIQLMRGKEPDSFDYKMACVKWNKTTGESGGHTVTETTEDPQTGAKNVNPALDGDKVNEISASQDGGAVKGATERNLAKVATGEEAGEGLSKTFSVTEAIGSVIAIAANICAAICMGYQIKDDFKNGESVGVEVMDIMSEISTCLQVISGVVELGAMVLGVECIAIPIVGFIIAIIGIVLFFCELFIPHKAPPDPVLTYISAQKSSFVDPIPPPPGVSLTYNLAGSSGTNITKGQTGSIVLTITNPSNSTIMFRSIAFRFTAGTQADELFVPPDGKDATTGKSPINNLVTYELVNAPAGWAVQGAPVANNTDGSMMAKLISTDNTNGSLVPQSGFQLKITGTVNSVAGTVTCRLSEGAVSRPGVTGIPSGDYYTSFTLTKM